jgi:hypothetical protein
MPFSFSLLPSFQDPDDLSPEDEDKAGIIDPEHKYDQ